MDFDPQKNYYDILWISESASESEIKTAFRKLAMKHHPDKWGDAEQFKKINEAYQVLSDDSKKSQYDAFRKWWWGFWWFAWGQAGGFWWFDFSGVNVDIGGIDLGDLLGWFMGGWGFGQGWSHRSRSHKWQDLQVSITISLKEAYHGTSQDIKYYRYITDPACKTENCATCNGRGVVSKKQQTVFGVMQTQSECPECQWMWVIYKKNGQIISGWMIKKEQEVTAKIPAGIEDGKYITYPGMGNDGIWWGSSWDLYVKIKITDRNGYRRKGDDLYTDVEVSLVSMVLGGVVQVDHPSGKIEVKIPKGTQVSDTLKISGKWFGTWGIRSKSGDLYLTPKVHIPKRLSKEEEKIWLELKKYHQT
jgi:molecular chaperone DnaJ